MCNLCQILRYFAPASHFPHFYFDFISTSRCSVIVKVNIGSEVLTCVLHLVDIIFKQFLYGNYSYHLWNPIDFMPQIPSDTRIPWIVRPIYFISDRRSLYNTVLRSGGGDHYLLYNVYYLHFVKINVTGLLDQRIRCSCNLFVSDIFTHIFWIRNGTCRMLTNHCFHVRC